MVIVYYGVSPYFPTGFEGVLPSIPNFTLVFPTGFSKDSPHIFPERFLGELYISHRLIFPIGFSKSYLIDYKTTRRSN